MGPSRLDSSGLERPSRQLEANSPNVESTLNGDH